MTQALQHLKFMGFDIDGVMTDGTLTYLPDGTETKTFYTLDGAGIRMLQQSGIVVGWITGRSSSAVAHRAKNLGITHQRLNDFYALLHANRQIANDRIRVYFKAKTIRNITNLFTRCIKI